MEIRTTQESFRRLHEAADGRGEFCKARKADLLKLLMDYSTMLAALEEGGKVRRIIAK